MNKFIYVTGNPRDGFRFIGPFDSHDDASEYADQNNGDGDWWIVELEQP